MNVIKSIVELMDDNEFPVSCIIIAAALPVIQFAFADFFSALGLVATTALFCFLCLFVCCIVTPSLLWLFKLLLKSGEVK